MVHPVRERNTLLEIIDFFRFFWAFAHVFRRLTLIFKMEVRKYSFGAQVAKVPRDNASSAGKVIGYIQVKIYREDPHIDSYVKSANTPATFTLRLCLTFF